MRVVDRIHVAVGRSRGIRGAVCKAHQVPPRICNMWPSCGCNHSSCGRVWGNEEGRPPSLACCAPVPPTTPSVHTYELFQQPYDAADATIIKYFGLRLAHLPIFRGRIRPPHKQHTPKFSQRQDVLRASQHLNPFPRTQNPHLSPQTQIAQISNSPSLRTKHPLPSALQRRT